MTTFAELDPASLPSYPAKAHKTGQARIVIDNRSQYLGRFGTSESLALYHLVCLNKLLTGSTPCTKDLREQLARIAGEQPPPRPAYTRPTFQLVVLLVTACLSAAIGAVSAWERNTELVQVNKPVLPGMGGGSADDPLIASVGDAQLFGDIQASMRTLQDRHKEKRLSEIVRLATQSIQEAENAGKVSSNGTSRDVTSVEEESR